MVMWGGMGGGGLAPARLGCWERREERPAAAGWVVCDDGKGFLVKERGEEAESTSGFVGLGGSCDDM